MIKTRTGRAILAMVPSAVLLFAYATGPEPRHTGAPGDDKLSCTSVGCHNTFALNVGGGNVRIDFPNGQTYTPGVKQTLHIVITDATARAFGFQLTARLESDLSNGQAGDFTAGPGQMVLCDDGNIKPDTGCSPTKPVQFIEHGPNSPFRTNTIDVTWTPPAAGAGNVHLYIAANAANNDGNNTGDHIYTADYVLTPQGASVAPVIISANSAGDFNPDAGLASGTWLEIKGSGFMTGESRSWGGGDFVGSKAPTQLNGISVVINNIPGYVSYISPTQINVQAPDDSTVGAGITIQVRTPTANSNVVTMDKKAIAPTLLAHPLWKVDGKQYVVAQFADQTFVGRVGLIAEVAFRPAKPGESVTIYGLGFGPVSPATPAGTIAAGLTAIQPQPVVKLGGSAVSVGYAGLVGGLVGLYQFNLTIPPLSPGDYSLTVDTGGVSANSGLFLTIGQ